MSRKELERKELTGWKKELESELFPLEEKRQRLLDEIGKAGARNEIIQRTEAHVRIKYANEYLKLAEEKWKDLMQFEEKHKERMDDLKHILAAIEARLQEISSP